MIGDVLEDYYGGRWFCINGSPFHQNLIPSITDHTAWFVSFDYEVVNGISYITEDELPEVAAHLLSFFHSLGSQQGSTKLSLENGVLGSVGQHILDYAGVDLRKLVSKTDSTWTFTDKDQKQTSSKSTSYSFNIAYRAKNYNPDKSQAIARCILDYTQAGNKRSAAPDGFKDWRFLCYKNYETYDPDRITLTEAEKAVGMTKWQALWPTTDDVMYLTDINEQNMVDKYAKGDKWQKSPRTTAETNVTITDYLWNSNDKDFATKKTSLFQEPVLCFRVMKITDEGGKNPNLVSEKGSLFKIVHLQDDPELYKNLLQALWVTGYSQDSQSGFFLNNQLFPLPKVPGLE